MDAQKRTTNNSLVHVHSSTSEKLWETLWFSSWDVKPTLLQCNVTYREANILRQVAYATSFTQKAYACLRNPGLAYAKPWYDTIKRGFCNAPDIHSVSSRHLGPNVGGKLQSTRKVDLRLGRPDLGGRPGWHPNLKNFLIKKGAIANVLNTTRFLIWDSAHSAWTRCFGRFSKGIASNKQVSALGETTSHAVHDRTAAQIKQEMVIAMACTCRLPGGKLEPWN